MAGQIYLITFTTHRRRRLFTDFERACAVIRAQHALRGEPTRILAWVLMPDHWHGLVEVGDGADLSRWIGRLKAAMARAMRLAEPDIGRIWTKTFHDHALRQEEDLIACARYLVLNPIRAGLVRRIGDYPYWDAVWLQ